MTALRNLWLAMESGFRAGLKQYRRRRSQLRKAALPDPFMEPNQ